MSKKQLPLNFGYLPYMDVEDFIVSAGNKDAFDLLNSWPNWPFFAINLYGPKHSGKTHLSHIFADTARVEASKVDIDTPPVLFAQNHLLVVENLDENIDEEAMFHLYNLYRNEGGNILFTSLIPPARMNFQLPDLRSRLNSVPSVEIKEPDDELLRALVVKLFMDRQITLPLEVLNYTLANMERSFAYTHKLVAEVDRISLAEKRAITIPIVKEAISCLS